MGIFLASYIRFLRQFKLPAIVTAIELRQAVFDFGLVSGGNAFGELHTKEGILVSICDSEKATELSTERPIFQGCHTLQTAWKNFWSVWILPSTGWWPFSASPFSLASGSLNF